MRRISILNFKGGVGKTSLATNLAHALTLQGATVLLVDCDMQGNASSILPDEITAPTLTNVLKGDAVFTAAIHPARERLDIVPADISLSEAALHISAVGTRAYFMLANATKKLTGYDFLLFDHSPSYSPVSECALLATDEMLIPCELSPFSVKAVNDMLEKLSDTLTPLNHEIDLIGIVPSKMDSRYKMSGKYLNLLKDTFSEERILRPIRTDAAVSKSQSVGQTVFEYETDAEPKAREDFTALAKTLITWEASV